MIATVRNFYADSCFGVASCLTDPVIYAHRTFYEATQIKEGVTRLVPAIQCLVFSSLALLTGLPGIVFRVIGSSVQTHPFSHSLSAPETSLDKKRFTLLSWNVAGIDSGHTYLCAGLIPMSQRIDAIAKTIINTNADVVCLSEMMDWKTSQVMRHKLAQAGYLDCYYNIGPNMAVSSGLFVASKLPTTDPQFTPFRTAVGRTKGANKGVFSFGIKEGKNQVATICMTHPQHSEETEFPQKEEISVREHHLQVVQNQVKKGKGCVIATGDLNAQEHELKKVGLLRDMTIGSCSKGATWDGDDFSASLTGQRPSVPARIDWTLVKKGTGSISTTYVPTGFNPKTLDPRALSDHKGLPTQVRCA